ncbi:MAG: Mov34/MPN/PAD-1 family protein, partial [Acidobacteria bacterium]|nr:Mov34/MPN/PAD-1 family protein [Acidobacteriota bacterium]
MATALRQLELERIREHGAQTYPNECCGVLLGKEQDGRKVVVD